MQSWCVKLLDRTPWPWSLRPPELRSQRDLVLAAVVGHGHALQFASDELKEDLT